MTGSGWRRVSAWSALALLLCACEHREVQTKTQAEPSPNATIVPQPLLTGTGWVATKPSALPVPSGTAPVGKQLRKENTPQPVPFDPTNPPKALPKASLAETPLMLDAVFSWPAVATRATFHGLRGAALKSTRAAVERRIRIDLRVEDQLLLELRSPSFALQRGTSMGARSDYLGFILGFPRGRQHRLIPQGVVRNLFREGRADASPLLSAVEEVLGPAQHGDVPVARSRLRTGHGTVTLSQATYPKLGAGGVLLCRFLIELVGVAPNSTACRVDMVPLAAEFETERGGRLVFDVTRVQRGPDEQSELPVLPPPQVDWEEGRIPLASGLVLPPESGRSLRPGAPAATASLRIRNHESVAGHVLLNQALVAVVRSDTELELSGLDQGAYTVEVVDFFGHTLLSRRAAEVPGTLDVGEPSLDVGAP